MVQKASFKLFNFLILHSPASSTGERIGFTKEFSFSHGVEQSFAFFQFTFPSDCSVSLRPQVCGGLPLGLFPFVLACQAIVSPFVLPVQKKCPKHFHCPNSIVSWRGISHILTSIFQFLILSVLLNTKFVSQTVKAVWAPIDLKLYCTHFV